MQDNIAICKNFHLQITCILQIYTTLLHGMASGTAPWKFLQKLNTTGRGCVPRSALAETERRRVRRFAAAERWGFTAAAYRPRGNGFL